MAARSPTNRRGRQTRVGPTFVGPGYIEYRGVISCGVRGCGQHVRNQEIIGMACQGDSDRPRGVRQFFRGQFVGLKALWAIAKIRNSC